MAIVERYPGLVHTRPLCSHGDVRTFVTFCQAFIPWNRI
jgi:hypothetical protein